jgi:hypothetical protein
MNKNSQSMTQMLENLPVKDLKITTGFAGLSLPEETK